MARGTKHPSNPWLRRERIRRRMPAARQPALPTLPLLQNGSGEAIAGGTRRALRPNRTGRAARRDSEAPAAWRGRHSPSSVGLQGDERQEDSVTTAMTYPLARVGSGKHEHVLTPSGDVLCRETAPSPHTWYPGATVTPTGTTGYPTCHYCKQAL
jgi:hypothetical protein